MALLSESTRKTYFEKLGLGEYNKENIKKLQKKYMRSADVDGIYGPDTDRVLRNVYNCSQVKNFKPEEFRCPCGRCTGYPAVMQPVELNHIQTIRSHYDRPMIITSGLRCNYENERVGGISNSTHKTGYAVDFYMSGVTDTIKHRESALKYIKTLPDHQFTYGACVVDSDGVYRTASSMDNAMHTETHEPVKKKSVDEVAWEVLAGKWGNGDKRVSKLKAAGYDPDAVQKRVNEIVAQRDNILSACIAQADCMKNSAYAWESNPTIEKSKKRGTCVTYVACVLQRLGILPSGKYVWHNESGKVYGNNNKMKVTYPGQNLRDLKSSLRAGDIIMDGDKYDPGSGSHIFIFTGKWDGDRPIIWDNHSAQEHKGAYAYGRNRPVIAIVRII